MKNKRPYQFGDDWDICTRCGKWILVQKSIMLNLDRRTNTYTTEPVPSAYSQGPFRFGPECAEIEFRKHKEIGFRPARPTGTPDQAAEPRHSGDHE